MSNAINLNIKNIIFDLDGTLVHRLPRRVFFIQDYLEDHGIMMNDEQQKAAGQWSHKFWENITIYDPNENSGGENPWVRLWLDYLDHYTEILSLPKHSLDSLFQDLAVKIEEQRGAEQVMDGALDVLSRLQSSGYRMGVLSNRHRPIAPVIEEHGLRKYFDAVHSSGELGAEKPDPEIFFRYLEVFGGIPAETLYVGDNYWLDGKGAINAGLQPVLLDLYGWFDDFEIPTIKCFQDLISYLD